MDMRQQRKSAAAEQHYAQGRACLGRGEWRAAAASFNRAIAQCPDNAAYHRAAGLAIVRLDRYDTAIRAFRRALDLDPSVAGSWADLGITLAKAGRPAAAVPCLEWALAMDPRLDQARAVLAHALADEGEPDRALAILDRVGASVEDPELQHARGIALLRQARVAEALAALRRALALDPNFAAAYPTLLYALPHQPGIDAAALHVEHRRWAALQERQLPARPPFDAGLLDPERRPVIGLVSGDFREHAVAILTIRAIEGLARRGYRIVCFANQDEADAMSVRFKAAAASWHPIATLGDDDLHALIRRRRIDVLIDLSGHTKRHRLSVFAARAAPLQGSWAGYAGTTGLTHMDFLIADPIQVPAGEDGCYAEHVLRLPDGYATYDPPADAPPVGPLPCLDVGSFTFGCFNRPQKLNDGLFAAWARILKAVPDSRLLLKYRGIDTGQTHAVIAGLARDAGIAPERVAFEPGSAAPDMQAAYGRVDLALDSFPYSGGVTTLEAAWMGVPVVTWPGPTFAGRHSAAHLHALGLDALIADSADDYVARAVALARDRDQLAGLRAGLRPRVAASPLCDGDRFAAQLGAALQELWRQRCATLRRHGPAIRLAPLPAFGPLPDAALPAQPD